MDRLLSTWAALEVALNLNKLIDYSLEDKALYFRTISAIITSTPLYLLVITYHYIDFLAAIAKALNFNGRLDFLNTCPYLVLRRSKTIHLTPFRMGLDTSNLPLDALLILLAQY